nr:hypothetical protein Iba_chr11dCG14050 [Ipomoea batatas]
MFCSHLLPQTQPLPLRMRTISTAAASISGVSIEDADGERWCHNEGSRQRRARFSGDVTASPLLRATPATSSRCSIPSFRRPLSILQFHGRGLLNSFGDEINGEEGRGR